MKLAARGIVLAVGACAVVGLVVVGALRGRAGVDGPSRGTRLVYSLDTTAAPDGRAAIARAADVIRDRIAERGAPTRVATAGDTLVVEIGPMDDESRAGVEDIIARMAHVELMVVDEDPAVMSGIADETQRSDVAHAASIGVAVDAWTDDRGRSHRDPYLRAEDRETEVSEEDARAMGCTNQSRRCIVAGHVAIERFLEDATGSAPDAWLPPGRRLVYGRVEPPDHSRPYWRTYLVDLGGRIDGTTVIDAKTAWDPQTNRPQVWIRVAPAATQLAEQTRAKAGGKLAVVFDDHVVAAPVINAAIAGTDLVLTMGDGRERDQEMAAVDVVAALRAGSLPAPLVLESSHPFDRGAGGFLARSWLFFAAAGLIAAALVAVLLLSASRSAGTPSRSA